MLQSTSCRSRSIGNCRYSMICHGRQRLYHSTGCVRKIRIRRTSPSFLGIAGDAVRGGRLAQFQYTTGRCNAMGTQNVRSPLLAHLARTPNVRLLVRPLHRSPQTSLRDAPRFGCANVTSSAHSVAVHIHCALPRRTQAPIAAPLDSKPKEAKFFSGVVLGAISSSAAEAVRQKTIIPTAHRAGWRVFSAVLPGVSSRVPPEHPAQRFGRPSHSTLVGLLDPMVGD
ncbi:hypothetical protein CALVIDRAFT_411873 [Calocera viscosa TUFC12733]|uniref:Uncharacterized protein n=1 Tax=Calocera viscosa (strain TUFC12733) TaxID=1330018 RepID=A0A167G4V6_CALVF|nr:hypothetical protein CALVIDRAFT_411873 [Calocera viscosa TUFC12733]